VVKRNRPMKRSDSINLSRREDGCFILNGVLDFQTVPVIRQQGLDLFSEAPSLVLDLQGVSRSDSAGLALLIEWMRFARSQNKPISFINMPTQMLAIARVSSLDSILPLARG
jgi:phospholipid transport system transporter-binding protein